MKVWLISLKFESFLSVRENASRETFTSNMLHAQEEAGWCLPREFTPGVHGAL